MSEFSNNNQIFSKLRDITENPVFRIIGYFILLLSLSAPLFAMALAAFETPGLVRKLILISGELFGIQATFLYLGGLYLGLIILLWIDITKRWTGILLAILSAFAFSVVGASNILIIDTISVLTLIFGVFSGLVLGGGANLLAFRLQLEFSEANKIVYMFFIISVFFIYTDSHLIYNIAELKLLGIRTETLIVDTVVVIMALLSINRIFNFEPEKRITVIGPERSGKTTLLITMYQEVMENQGDLHSNPSKDLYDELRQVRLSENWPQATKSTHEYSFQYWSEGLLQETVKLRSIDYPGEILSTRLIDIISKGGSNVDAKQENQTKRQEEPTTDELKSKIDIAKRVADEIIECDLLIFILDTASFLDNPERFGIEMDSHYANPESYLEIYEKIARELPDKKILLISTKSDYLKPKFLQDELPEDTHIDERNYNQFKNYVNWEFYSEEVGQKYLDLAFLRKRSSYEIHPVYIQLDEERSVEEGRPVAKIPMNSVGIQQLLEILN